MQQVRTRLEGQRRQYDLRQRALELRLPGVVVIDEDQGPLRNWLRRASGFGRLCRSMLGGGCGVGVRSFLFG